MYRIPLFGTILGLSVWGCQTSKDLPPLKTVPHVEIERFMIPWFVIASIPTFIEEGAHNAVEEYILRSDGDIDVNFTFNKDSFDGPKRSLHPKGFIYDKNTNAEWRMQFVWPFKADYLIIDLDPNYNWTVVGVPSRRYVWIMSRTPQLDADTYNSIVQRLRDVHRYDVNLLKLVPQKL